MDNADISPTHLNQTVVRTEQSVWERQGWDGSRRQVTVTRALIGVGGGALALQGIRFGSWKGRALATLGGTLAWWALTGAGDLSEARRWFSDVVRRGQWPGADDQAVTDASTASFPASDSPSWTPTVGTGLRRKVRG